MRIRRAALFFVIAAAQFVVFEAALRTWGHSEAAPAFQGLFMPAPLVGYRLVPGAHTRYDTSEFSTTIAINGQGVRDDRDIGPKPPGEKRIVVLGDSLVLSVQVSEDQTFCHLLEERLNQGATSVRYRVINAGVQGYGPVQELYFYRMVAKAFQPDLVIETLFVGNDAEDAAAAASLFRSGAEPAAAPAAASLSAGLRRLVRSSMVLQILRLRTQTVLDRLPRWGAPPEAPLQTYAAHPSKRIDLGLDVTRDAVNELAQEAAAGGARTMIALMPARFQVNDIDYGHLRDAVAQAGGTLVRQAGTERFAAALAPLKLPMLDLLPALRAGQQIKDVFFLQTVHLTPRGHEIVAAQLERFVRDQGF